MGQPRGTATVSSYRCRSGRRCGRRLSWLRRQSEIHPPPGRGEDQGEGPVTGRSDAGLGVEVQLQQRRVYLLPGSVVDAQDAVPVTYAAVMVERCFRSGVGPHERELIVDVFQVCRRELKLVLGIDDNRVVVGPQLADDRVDTAGNNGQQAERDQRLEPNALHCHLGMLMVPKARNSERSSSTSALKV